MIDDWDETSADEAWVRSTLRVNTTADVPDADLAVTQRVRASTIQIYDELVALPRESDDEIDSGVVGLSAATAPPRRRPSWTAIALGVAAAAVMIVSLTVLATRGPDTSTPSTTPDISDGLTTIPAAPQTTNVQDEISTLPQPNSREALGELVGALDGVTVTEVGDGFVTLNLQDSASQTDREVSVIEVDRWGPPLAVDDNLKLGENTSLRDWLAASDNDQSTLVPTSIDGESVSVQVWHVLLTAGAAETVGCDGAAPCGVVATSRSGRSISLIPDSVNELAILQPESGQPLVVAVALPPSTSNADVFLADFIDGLAAQY